ncbi:unnamed protein product [Euphydryas editha]|uniref:Uncharacterized protein n=1 Tax=Euphydryas editha TaxID=104508 RepID=A0AAU9VBW6_EUPED|nr:unnamed protein product [Euphydryas editha]
MLKSIVYKTIIPHLHDQIGRRINNIKSLEANKRPEAHIKVSINMSMKPQTHRHRAPVRRFVTRSRQRRNES